jgi:hypothetical protein
LTCTVRVVAVAAVTVPVTPALLKVTLSYWAAGSKPLPNSVRVTPCAAGRKVVLLSSTGGAMCSTATRVGLVVERGAPVWSVLMPP